MYKADKADFSVLVFAKKGSWVDDDGFLLLFLRILLLGNLPGFFHQPSRILLSAIQPNLPISVDLDPTYLYKYPSRILSIVPQEKTNIDEGYQKKLLFASLHPN